MAAKAVFKQTFPLVFGAELVGVTSSFWSSDRSKAQKRLKVCLERLARTGALYAGLYSLTRGRRSALWLFACGSSLHLLLKPFNWGLTLYFCLRAIANFLRRNKMAFHLHPVLIYVSHCLHNDLLVNRADWVEPSYIGLWLRTTPGYKTESDWIADFGSQQPSRYKNTQVGDARMKMVPQRIMISFKRQLPFVASLYLVPQLIFFKRTVKRHFSSSSSSSALQFVAGELTRVARTSLVLAVLPYLLTEFPCMYDKLLRVVGKTDGPAHRAPIAHVLLSALLTTPVFMAEPEGRLNMMVVYTWWRILQAWIRTFGKESDTPAHREALSAGLIGITCSLAAK